jgi:hypothetical protein
MGTVNIQSIIDRYNELQPEGGNYKTPRKGFYYILNVYADTKWVPFYKATALWKETKEEEFNQSIRVTIQLVSLQENCADPESFNPFDLLKRVVEITSTGTIPKDYLSKTFQLVICNWKINQDPIVVTPVKLSFLQVLDKVSFDEAMDVSNDSLSQVTGEDSFQLAEEELKQNLLQELSPAETYNESDENDDESGSDDEGEKDNEDESNEK